MTVDHRRERLGGLVTQKYTCASVYMAQSRFAVCIIDDDASLRSSVMRLLSEHGYDVEAFDSALAFLKHGQPNASCRVLLDVSMPEMDGFELVRQLRRAGRRDRVVLMSARDDDETQRLAAELGVTELIRKPFSIDDVVAALGRAQPLPPA
jgi:FixJ family two-component response regulator